MVDTQHVSDSGEPDIDSWNVNFYLKFLVNVELLSYWCKCKNIGTFFCSSKCTFSFSICLSAFLIFWAVSVYLQKLN